MLPDRESGAGPKARPQASGMKHSACERPNRPQSQFGRTPSLIVEGGRQRVFRSERPQASGRRSQARWVSFVQVRVRRDANRFEIGQRVGFGAGHR